MPCLVNCQTRYQELLLDSVEPVRMIMTSQFYSSTHMESHQMNGTLDFIKLIQICHLNLDHPVFAGICAHNELHEVTEHTHEN